MCWSTVLQLPLPSLLDLVVLRSDPNPLENFSFQTYTPTESSRSKLPSFISLLLQHEDNQELPSKAY